MTLDDVVNAWKNCQQCGLHRFRRNVVVGEGSTPADVMFIGEAPGKSEDLLGRPFIGESGKLLRDTLDDVMNDLGMQSNRVSIFITNVVACRPTDAPKGANRQPSPEEAWTCWSRLQEVARLVQPKVVIFLGKVADKFCRSAFPNAKKVVHPAYALREPTERRRLFQELKDVLKELL